MSLIEIVGLLITGLLTGVGGKALIDSLTGRRKNNADAATVELANLDKLLRMVYEANGKILELEKTVILQAQQIDRQQQQLNAQGDLIEKWEDKYETKEDESLVWRDKAHMYEAELLFHHIELPVLRRKNKGEQ